MAQAARPRPRGAGKAQLHESALRLFARDGVDGTSLQSIADDMGVTKAAVYYHYKTKDDLVLGVLRPVFERLEAILTAAEAHRSRQARAEEFISGIIDLLLDSLSRYSMLSGDPYVSRLLEGNPEMTAVWPRVVTLLCGPDPEPATLIPLQIFMAGLIGPLNDPGSAALDNAVLRRHLLDAGRRLLNLRRRPLA